MTEKEEQEACQTSCSSHAAVVPPCQNTREARKLSGVLHLFVVARSCWREHISFRGSSRDGCDAAARVPRLDALFAARRVFPGAASFRTDRLAALPYCPGGILRPLSQSHSVPTWSWYEHPVPSPSRREVRAASSTGR